MNGRSLASLLIPSTFHLTDAVRPAPPADHFLQNGYRVGRFRDRNTRLRLKTLSASVSAESLFPLFLDLVALFGDSVDVVLETSHRSRGNQHEDLRRYEIDKPVLMSYLCEYEGLLVNDGCTGVVIVDPVEQLELQFDEHKLLHIYAPQLKPFRAVLARHGIEYIPGLRLISDAPHLHHTTAAQEEEFRELCSKLGAGDFDMAYTDENFSSYGEE